MGQTYYGCCENCKKTLVEKPLIRAGVDPLSGKTVDKAAAVIGKLANGNEVYYFESRNNLLKFAQSMEKY